MWLENKCICYLALHCIPYFAFFAFLVHFWDIFEFTLILLVLFDFLDQTCLYCSLEGFPTGFAIFRIFYEQLSQNQIHFEDFECNSGQSEICTADGPRVRGGRSAIGQKFQVSSVQKQGGQHHCNADGPQV